MPKKLLFKRLAFFDPFRPAGILLFKTSLLVG